MYDVTQDFHINGFHGESVDEADFPSLLDRATEIIEEQTMYRLTETLFESMDEATQIRIQKAICAQIEYIDANGGSEFDNDTGLASAGLGKFNYSASTSSGGTIPRCSPRALRILAPTGLLYRGGGRY
ncbi:MAG: hypothetical protein R3Y58_08645 [Eubacteriales bacterium]